MIWSYGLMAVAAGISVDASTPIFAICLVGSVIGGSSIDTADVGYHVIYSQCSLATITLCHRHFTRLCRSIGA